MRLAVIPARGGSKRIPAKNIKLFLGKPIIQWSVNAAIESRCFDRIIVSTDNDEIAAVARSCGAEVPFVRPPDLSDDYTATTPVIAHAIRWQMQNGENPAEVCCIYATAPFLAAADLQHGFDMLKDTGCDFAFPVTSFPFPIQRAVRVSKKNRIEMLDPVHFHTRSQDLEEAYHDAGQFYWGRAEAWLEERPLYTSNAVAIILPRHKVQDIDTPEDWARAELMIAAANQEKALND